MTLDEALVACVEVAHQLAVTGQAAGTVDGAAAAFHQLLNPALGDLVVVQDLYAPAADRVGWWRTSYSHLGDGYYDNPAGGPDRSPVDEIETFDGRRLHWWGHLLFRVPHIGDVRSWRPQPDAPAATHTWRGPRPDLTQEPYPPP